MEKTYESFCDFVDDCFVDEDSLYNIKRDESSELFPTKFISGMIQEDFEPKACLVSLMDEPKVA